MKKLLVLPIAAIMLFTSCKKGVEYITTPGPTDTVTQIVTKIDTTGSFQLLGQWSDGIQGIPEPGFTTDRLIYTNGGGSIQYAASADSIYFLGGPGGYPEGGHYYPNYVYKMSANADTLWLKNISTIYDTFKTYTRVR